MPFPKPGGSGLDQLTGDVLAGPGTGSQAATLATVATPGTVGDTTHYPVITLDAKGRVTTATAQVAPTGSNGIGQVTGDVTTPAATSPDQSVAGTLVGTPAVNTVVGGLASVTSKAALSGATFTGPVTSPGVEVITTSTGTTAQSLSIVDSLATGSKSIRMDGANNLQILNNAFSAPIFSLADNGNLTAFGTVAMSANKITGLTNGTVATDAAAFGQIPTALPPNGAASGDLTGTYPAPTLAGTTNVNTVVGNLPSVATNVVRRSATATAGVGETTVFTGATAAQTITAPPTAGYTDLVYTIVNDATVSVTLAGGTNSLSVNGTIAASFVIPAGTAYDFVWDGTGIWQCRAISQNAGGALPYVNGHLVSSVTLPHAGTATTVYTTPSLAVGTWLITSTIDVESGSPPTAAATASAQIVAGTATATVLDGVYGPLIKPGLVTVWTLAVTTTYLVVVTVAGTMLIQGQYTDTTIDGIAVGGTQFTGIKIG